MSYPRNVDGRTLVIGGGVHGTIYAATYRAVTGGSEPIVCEARSSFGGIFGAVLPFRMNSTHRAGIDSVTGGPTRIDSRSDHDNLNFLPNATYQVSSDSEYPSTEDMAKAIRRNLAIMDEVYTDARLYVAGNGMDVYECDSDGESGRYLGTPKRIIWATGLTMNGRAEGTNPVSGYRSPAVVTAETFLGNVSDFRGRYSGRVGIIGGGDTACTVVEYLLGQGQTAIFGDGPTDIDWYGGYTLPVTKKAWSRDYHARYIGLARHMPQNGREGIIHPKSVQVDVSTFGNYAQVQGRNYALVIDCRGFKPWASPVSTSEYVNANGQPIARRDYSQRFFKVGPAADIGRGNPYFPNKFPAANQAIYVTGPRTAMLAEMHAAEDLRTGDRG